jgi:hypothetical protein
MAAFDARSVEERAERSRAQRYDLARGDFTAQGA